MFFFIIFVLLLLICWSSLLVILLKKPVCNFKSRNRIIFFLYGVALVNVIIAAICDSYFFFLNGNCLVVALLSVLPVMFGSILLKRYFSEKLSESFFPFRVGRIVDGRIFGKVLVDDLHMVVDAELVAFPDEMPLVGQKLWVDVKNSNVDLPFATVVLH